MTDSKDDKKTKDEAPDPKFKKVVQKFLNTPPKPHNPKPKKETQADGKRRGEKR